ncbi:alginate export family protein [Methylotenera sp.]|uniref:alginate export family protein n=1 Tax=Methylotenera sp. TaxID=2051956 RepID=UPI0024891EB1|nr:alginate export family protein [Methylotenera sp.]MDI1360695.1 alginate export family protein [Methylotenera sp.]
MNTKFKSSSTFKLNLLMACTTLALTSMAQNVYAEDAVAEPEYTFLDSVKEGKPMTSFRLRYENVQQDGNGPAGTPFATKPLEDANAFTLRSLIGWQTSPFHNFSFAAQIINVTKLNDNYNDGTAFSPAISAGSNQPDHLGYAKVVDPDQTNINQAYIDWTGLKNTKFRLGRQQTNLDNVRFIGDIGFRQVMQVFDGVSVTNKSIPDTNVYAAHFESVNQINTRYRTAGALDIVNAKYSISGTEGITGYGYFSKFDDLGFGNAWFGGTTNAGRNQSNKTLGLRLDGVHPFNPNFRAAYTAEYAKQTDYSGGDSLIDAHYLKLGGGVGFDAFNIRIDQETLSSNDGKFAFQTPFGTNHLFQGWVDKFLATPRQGIKDTFVTATYRLDDFLFFADYHVINSDVDFAKVGGGTGDKYGKEWNVAVTYNVNSNIMTKLEYGKFTESDQYVATANRIRDTDKLWLTAMYTF